MKTYQVNMLKKYISREFEGNVVPVDDTDGATVAVAGVIHQVVKPKMGEVPGPEGDRQEGTQDAKSGELPEDLRRLLREVFQKYPDIFKDVPGHLRMCLETHRDWYRYLHCFNGLICILYIVN